MISSSDLAVLDIRLGSETCFDLAELLRAQEIPFVFATGFDRNFVPAKFDQVPVLTKPISRAEIALELNRQCSRLREYAASIDRTGTIGEFGYSLTEHAHGCNWQITNRSGAFVAAGSSSSSLTARAEALRYLLERSRRTRPH